MMMHRCYYHYCCDEQELVVRFVGSRRCRIRRGTRNRTTDDNATTLLLFCRPPARATSKKTT